MQLLFKTRLHIKIYKTNNWLVSAVVVSFEVNIYLLDQENDKHFTIEGTNLKIMGDTLFLGRYFIKTHGDSFLT